MSHSIHAYLWSGKTDELAHEDVASLDYNSSERERSFVFYRLIGAEQYDGGCSGVGSSAPFARNVFEKALHLLKEYNCVEELSQEVEFLTKCLEHETVYISFY